MKLVYFGFVIHYGGGPKALVGIARRLAQHHRVEVIDAYGACPTYLKDLRAAGIPVHVLVPETHRVVIGGGQRRLVRLFRILAQLPVFLKLIIRLSKTVRALKPDAVWTNIKTPMLFWAVTPGVRRVPFVRSVIECPKVEELSRFEKRCLRRLPARLVAVSTETKRMLGSLGIPEERIEIISDTLEPEALLQRSHQPLQAELPGMQGYPKVVVPATLLRSKGQHTAIKAMTHLRERGYRPTLWLAGDTVGDDQSYWNELVELVLSEELTSCVHFLGWREDLPAIIDRADLVAFPSRTEGFGLVVLEAFLLRKPVVATYVGGIKDQIEPGINGLEFPIDDYRQMAEQMCLVLSDPIQAGKLVDQGYQTAMKKFSPEKNTQGYLSVFAKAVQRNAEPMNRNTTCP